MDKKINIPWTWKELSGGIAMLGIIGAAGGVASMLGKDREEVNKNESKYLLKRNGYLLGVILLSFVAFITFILFLLHALTYTDWKSKSANTTYKSGIKDFWNGLHQSHGKYWRIIFAGFIVFAITLTVVGFVVPDLEKSNELVYVFFALAGIFFFLGFYSIGKSFDGRDFMWELYNEDKLEKYDNEIDDYQKNSSELNRIKLGLILEKSKDDVEKGITRMERRLEKMKEKGESEKSESILKLKEMIEDYTVRKTQLDEKAKLSGVEQEQLESENIKSRLGTIAGRTGLLSQKNLLAEADLAAANEKLTAAKEAKEEIEKAAVAAAAAETELRNELSDLKSSTTSSRAQKEAIESEIRDKIIEQRELEDNNTRATGEISRAKEEARLLQEQNESLTGYSSRAREDISNVNEKARLLQIEAKKSLTEKSKLEAAIFRKENERNTLARRKTALTVNLADAGASLQNLQSEIQEKSERLVGLSQPTQDEKDEIKDLMNKKTQLKEEYEANLSKKSSVESQLENNERFRDLMLSRKGDLQEEIKEQNTLGNRALYERQKAERRLKRSKRRESINL